MSNELTFHSAANSGDTLYVHVENMVGQVWNGSAFEAPVSGNWGDYDITLTEQATSTGIFRGDMPAVAAGAYSFVVRLQAGGSPAVGDIVLGSSAVFSWSGTVVGDMVEIAKVVWDRVLTGATHNIASSAGRRLRGVQAFGDYANGALWFDSENGVGGQVAYENATVQNPSNSLTDVLAIASSLNMVRIEVAPGSTVTMTATLDNFSLRGNHWDLELESQSISNTVIVGANVSGIGTGANHPHFELCQFGTVTLPACHMHDCIVENTITLGAGSHHLEQIHCGAAALLDFGGAVGSTTVLIQKVSGNIEVQNVGQSGTDVLYVEGTGKLTVNANCIGGTIFVRGNVELSDSGSATVNGDARVDVGQINAQVDAALNTEIPGSPTADSVNQRVKAIDVLSEASGSGDLAAMKVILDALTAAAAAKLALSAGTIVSGVAEAGTLSTTQMTSDLAEATDDHFIGRIVIWISGVLANQASDITGYSGATGLLTFTEVTEAPSADDTFIIV